jgi:hypothetical protein
MKKPVRKTGIAAFIFLLMATMAYGESSAGLLSLSTDKEDSAVNRGDPRVAACPNFTGDVGFGQITAGIRAGACTLFDPGSIGFGLGFQLRIRLMKHWSLEGYGDKFKTTIQHFGYRTDARYGINGLYYWVERPFRRHKFTPYLIIGLSYENIEINSYQINTRSYGNSSPWLDLGAGEHYYFTRRWDISLEAFYVMPLATHPASYL